MSGRRGRYPGERGGASSRARRGHSSAALQRANAARMSQQGACPAGGEEGVWGRARAPTSRRRRPGEVGAAPAEPGPDEQPPPPDEVGAATAAGGVRGTAGAAAQRATPAVPRAPPGAGAAPAEPGPDEQPPPASGAERPLKHSSAPVRPEGTAASTYAHAVAASSSRRRPARADEVGPTGRGDSAASQQQLAPSGLENHYYNRHNLHRPRGRMGIA